MIRTLRCALLHAGLLLLVTQPGQVAAQVDHIAAPAAPIDSVAARAAARRAQRQFEIIRVGALPVTDVRGQRACDVRVGRYCYWHETGARPPTSPERERVIRARRRLLQTLDSLGGHVPRDRWIAGQRVRYRLDGGDTTGAVQVAASDCGAVAWWCDALLGYARHVSGDHVAAAGAYATALSAMSEEDRCAWEDPALLLEDPARRHLRSLPCMERARAVARIWWLATPLLSREANDLRTEFLARRTVSALEADASYHYGVRWGWDTDELLLRYGWPVWWTRERTFGLQGPTEPSLVGHEATPSFNFFPGSRILTDTAAMPRADDWRHDQALPRMRYAPGYLRAWRRADAQVTRFLRGDTLLVVAAYAASGDTLLRSPVAHLVVSPAPDVRRFTRARASASGVIDVRVPRTALKGVGLVSVEIIDTATGGLARHRAGLADISTGRLALSDLLLHSPSDDLAQTPSFRELVRLALQGVAVSVSRVGIYWETYGVRPGGEALDVTLTLERTSTPWIRRAATRIGLARRATPLQIRWRESPGPEHGGAPRSVTVNVGDLAPGEYRVSLSAHGDDGAAATSTRTIVLVR